LLNEGTLRQLEKGLWYITAIVIGIALALSIFASFNVSRGYVWWTILWSVVFFMILLGLIKSK